MVQPSDATCALKTSSPSTLYHPNRPCVPLFPVTFRAKETSEYDRSPTRRQSRQRPVLYRPSHRKRQTTLFLERLPLRPHRPNRHPHFPKTSKPSKKHCDDIRGSLAPVGALETTLAQSIAEDYWRLNRARALENAVFTLGLQKNFGAYDDVVPNPEVETALALGRTWTQQNRSNSSPRMNRGSAGPLKRTRPS